MRQGCGAELPGIAGKVALVTGAAGGIGAAVARALAGTGAVIAAADTREDRLQRLVDELRADGGKAAAYVADITDSAQARDLAKNAGRELGPIEILVNVAGVLRPGLLTELTEEDWNTTFAVNVTGAFNVCRAVVGGMTARQSGAIVTVASNAAGVPRMRMGAYAASKAASVMFTKCLGLELAGYGIRCNVVCPGTTETPMLRSLWADPDDHQEAVRGSLSSYRTGIPLGRIGQPQNVADAVTFLVSDFSRQITMHDLYVDGGAALR